MSSADAIVARWRVSARQRFIAAYKDTMDELRDCPDLPYDRGKLERGLKVTPNVLIGNTMKATFKSTAKARGFDYPAFIESVPRIQPNKAKYLKFKVGGQFVTSSGFDNPNFRWWTNCWREGDLWYESIQARWGE